MFVSGSEALGSVEHAIAEERARIAELERQIEARTGELERMRAEDLGDLRALAEVRLGEPSRREAVDRLDRAERRAREMLAARDAERAEAEAALARSADRLAELHRRRDDRAAAAARAEEAVAEAERGVRERLEDDPDHAARTARAEEAARMAEAAADKAARSEAEREEKGAACTGNRLFAYLHARRYGTPDYRALAPIRWADGRVARLIGYADAAANFRRLTGIPARLREHADRLAAEAEAAEIALRQSFLAARGAGGLGPLDAAAEDARRALAEADAEIEAAEAEERALIVRRTALVSGEDPQTRAAVEFLSAELRREGLDALWREAAETPFPEDDRIVGRMMDRDRDRRAVQAAADLLRESVARGMTRMEQLASVRGEFKRRRYEAPDSTFRDGALIGMLLHEFLEGALDGAGLWDRLGRQHTRRGPLPGPRSRPPRRSGGGVGGFPGGFRTGGGLGGGRFRTGGGF